MQPIPSSDAPEEAGPGAAIPPAVKSVSAVYDGVGVTLRNARARRNIDLKRAATELRIRAEFLDALEKGDYARLPGRAYAFGFIRSYANYLGLDAERAISAYRDETASAPTVDPLHFPAPVPQDRIPRAWVIASGVAAAMLIYALVAFFVSTDSDEQAAVGEPPTAQSAAAPEAPAEAPLQAAPDAALIAAPPADPAAAASSEPAPDAPAPGTVSASAPATPSTATPAATPAAAPAQPAEEAVTYGTDNKGGRVVMQATVDSWIQISDGGGTPIFTQVLRPGESYRVPAGRELWLSTGNAGGLEIRVDGKAIPPIGKSGSVRRGVSLAPDQLKAGGTQ